jgi:hypothetical protein
LKDKAVVGVNSFFLPGGLCAQGRRILQMGEEKRQIENGGRWQVSGCVERVWACQWREEEVS